MVQMNVQITGAEAWRVRLANPENVKEPMRQFLTKSVNVGRREIRGRIPKGETGKSRRSVRTRKKLGRFEATVFSRHHVVRFLDRGTYAGRRASAGGSRRAGSDTRRGIAARRIFPRGAKAAAPHIQRFANEMGRDVTRKLKG